MRQQRLHKNFAGVRCAYRITRHAHNRSGALAAGAGQHTQNYGVARADRYAMQAHFAKRCNYTRRKILRPFGGARIEQH